MRIGVDTRELVGKKAGKGWYVYHVLKSILEADTANQYLLYTDGEIDLPVFRNVKVIKISGHFLFWHFRVAQRLKKDGVDLYWAPTSPIVPAITNVPTILTIHDLTNILFPQTHTLKGRLIDNIFLPLAIKRCKKILAVSMATKNDIIKIYSVKKEKIVITPLGVDEQFKILPEKEIKEKVSKYGIEPEYILFLGTLEPRKNIITLIKAYGELSDEIRDRHPLVIGGKKGWLYEDIFQEVRKCSLEKKVIFLDYIQQLDLPALYNGASIFVFPSLYEGFGLPPLEAMACGKPVITSNVSSLPEVIGDAGILIEPKSIQSLALNIERILTNNKFRQELQKKSIRQARKFNWRFTARSTYKTISEIDL